MTLHAHEKLESFVVIDIGISITVATSLVERQGVVEGTGENLLSEFVGLVPANCAGIECVHAIMEVIKLNGRGQISSKFRLTLGRFVFY